MSDLTNLMKEKRSAVERIKERFNKGKHDVDMTEGSIVKCLFRFALPLLLGNLFQQLYNMVDTWVIGQTGENGAYAAVGSVGPIINILIGFFSGLASGAGVVISQYFGAKKEKEVHDAVHTAVHMTLVLAIIFTILGVLLAPVMLDLMLQSDGTESEVYPYAKTYLTIYFAGVSGLMIYNMGSGILRAVGDSTRPFIFLLVSAVTNTALDLLFVFVFKMGVAGVALATIIAQFLSAALTVITLLKTDSCVRVKISDIHPDRDMLSRTIKVGIPAALQMAITAFSNVFVQGYIAGVDGNQTFNLGGWTSYTKLDQFIFLPVQSLALSATTFVAQNLGVGDVKRAKKGTTTAYIMATSITAAVIAIVMIFARPLATIFNADENVVSVAVKLLTFITPFYLFCPVNQVFSAALRGAGDSKAPMFIMLGSFVAFRQIYLFVMSNYISNALIPVAMSYPAGWFVCCSCTLIYYSRFKFGKKKDI